MDSNASFDAQGQQFATIARMNEIEATTYASNPTTDPRLAESSEFRTLKLFLYFVILIFSSLGNGLVFYLISCNRRLRHASSNRLLLNLCACDFLTPLLSIPFDLALEERSYVWPYGGVMCRILWPASTLTATASALTLAAISLDRFRLLMHPFIPRLTKRQIKYAIITIHVISLAIIIPYITFLRLEDQECVEAWPEFRYRQAYTVTLFLAQYTLPLVFMTTVYALALSKLYSVTSNTTRMRSMEAKNLRKDSETNNNAAKRGAVRKISARVAYNMKHGFDVESNVRVTKMFVAVVVIFAVFMLPNQVVWLWSDFGGGHKHHQLNPIKIICWLFTYTNSVCNPVIFIIFCKDYRVELMALPKKLRNGPRLRLSISRSSGTATESIRSLSPRRSPVTSQSALNENCKSQSDENDMTLTSECLYVSSSV